jgi:hypothetical protein
MTLATPFRLAALAALAAGCASVPSPPPAAVPLTKQESRSALACQQAINASAKKLVVKGFTQLDRCVALAVELRLDEDRALASTPMEEVLARREAVAARCTNAFEQVGSASTRMIDEIVAACQPVAAVVLTDSRRGDPLRLRGLAALLGAFGQAHLVYDTVEEYAGLLCGVSVDAVGEMFYAKVPRTTDAVRILFDLSMSEFGDHLQSFIDPRCVALDD